MLVLRVNSTLTAQVELVAFIYYHNYLKIKSLVASAARLVGKEMLTKSHHK